MGLGGEVDTLWRIMVVLMVNNKEYREVQAAQVSIKAVNSNAGSSVDNARQLDS